MNPSLFCSSSPLARRCRNLFVAIAIAVLPTVPMQAAAITWGTPQNITGDTDVSTTGDIVYALNFGRRSVSTDPDPVVNGVTFTEVWDTDIPNIISFASTPGWSRTDAGNPSSYPNAEPFASLSPSYKALLTSTVRVINADGSAGTFTFSLQGLTVGATYQIQIWVSTARNTLADTIFSTTGGGSVTLDANIKSGTSEAELAGGLGQYVLGSFIATSPTQDITATSITTASGRAQINALQLREISSIPEPGTVALTAGVLSLLAVGCLRIFGIRSHREETR
ncbi:hypothetical protein OPIT5_12440 [Opitutaceae bacterium TAV5]|nr:hypothetical protein OPIT5_12440 [Opitutaceae bacterium TAV5]